VIDDFFHRQYADPAKAQGAGASAQALLQTAEASFAALGDHDGICCLPRRMDLENRGP
jgi:hypothetical protein